MGILHLPALNTFTASQEIVALAFFFSQILTPPLATSENVSKDYWSLNYDVTCLVEE